MSERAVENGSAAWKEADRLAALHGFEILDTEAEAAFDEIAMIAAQVCDTQVAAISFIDAHRQWLKARVGTDIRQIPLEASICLHAVMDGSPLVVPDTMTDGRFSSNPYVVGEPRFRFYAGVVLRTKRGLPIGTLCVLDHAPRPEGITQKQADALLALSRAVMRELALRRDRKILARRERGFVILADALPQMAWIAGADGQHEYRNQRYYEFTGAEPGALDGDGWNNVAHPDDRETTWTQWRDSISTGTPFEAKYRLRHHSGEYRWVLSRALPICDAHGNVERWIGTSTDIHEWKKAEQALAESEERHRALIEASAAMIWRAASDGSILGGWGWEEFCGQASGEYEGRGWLDVVHPDDRERIERIWRELVAAPRTGTSEYRVRHKDGQYRWVSARAVPLNAPDGSVREWVGTLTDIHEQKQAEEAVRTSEERLRLAVETTSLGIWDADLVTGQVQWAPETREILGLAPDAPITYQEYLELIHPEDRERVEKKSFEEVPGKGLAYTGSYRIIRADDGAVRWVAVNARALLDENGRVVRKIGTIQDVTERKLAENAMRASEERLRLALQAARMCAWEQDLTTDQVVRSENSLGLLEIGSGPLSEFLGRVSPEDQEARARFIARIIENGSDTMEFRYTSPAGKTMWLASRGEMAGPNRVIGVTFDISDRKAAEEEVWRSANHDSLTGLPNRVLFQQCLDRALERARESGTHVSLLLIDLDDFKDVNDTLGHDAGDALLKETATRLTALVRGCDTVARLGGDEFAVVVVEPLRLGNAASLATTMTQRLRQPFLYNGRTIVSRASIGVAGFPDHDSDPVELMKDADIALYRAKAEGRNRVVIYSPGMRAMAEQRLNLGREIREALSRDQLLPFYQPKVCLATGAIVGLEALARWRHDTKGILTPGTFGAAFDDPELATAVGKRLIGRVASDMRKWLDAGLSLGRVAVNLSSAEFSQPDLAEEILRILDLVKVPAEHFEIEVTERVLLEGRSGAVAEALGKFHRRGVQIALDDFGTGYASLTHLKQFPVGHIKIDKSFVRDLEQDAGNEAIVAAVIGLGRSLNLQVTAEGVETEGQALRLRKLDCHNAQGFYFAKPMAGSQVVHLLSKWVKLGAA